MHRERKKRSYYTRNSGTKEQGEPEARGQAIFYVLWERGKNGHVALCRHRGYGMVLQPGHGEEGGAESRERIRMITIGMNYKVLPGQEDHFERMFNNVLHSLETVTGHSKSALYKDVNALQSYLIVSEWASEDAFHAFVRSERFQRVVEWGQANILADRPVHTVYRGTAQTAPCTINMQTAEE